MAGHMTNMLQKLRRLVTLVPASYLQLAHLLDVSATT